jgi:hypothetical protein
VYPAMIEIWRMIGREPDMQREATGVTQIAQLGVRINNARYIDCAERKQDIMAGEPEFDGFWGRCFAFLFCQHSLNAHAEQTHALQRI